MHFKHNFFFTIFFPKVRIMSAWSHPILGKISKLFFEGFPKDCAASCTVRCGIFMWVLWKKNQNLILIFFWNVPKIFNFDGFDRSYWQKTKKIRNYADLSKPRFFKTNAQSIPIRPIPNQYQNNHIECQ